jgi:hypothetical protein
LALFFDRQWFDAKLQSRGLSRGAFAEQSGILPADLNLMFKDQMEIGADLVRVWARLLAEPEAEIARRSGTSTPLPQPKKDAQKLEALEARVALLEAQIAAFLKPQA